MPYVLNEDGTPFLDENGNKLEFSIEYSDADWYKHREGIHINADNHLDTEDRHIVIKEGIHDSHAVSKKQLDEINNNIYSKQDIDNKILALQNSISVAVNNLKSQITTQLQTHEAKILTQMLNFRNQQIHNRIKENTSQYLKKLIHGSNCLTIRTLVMVLMILKMLSFLMFGSKDGIGFITQKVLL